MKSLEELRVIRERMQGTVAYRSEHESLEDRLFWSVCAGTDHDCVSGGRVLFYGQGRRHS